VARGQKSITESLDAKLKKRRISGYDYALTNSRVVPLHDGSESWKKHFQSADLIIEAVFEDINVKHKVLKEMEELIPRYLILNDVNTNV
jgi:enoyl-CoA hydratase/long-chain 3-hydroxyacyl-CoA dehydrogenase